MRKSNPELETNIRTKTLELLLEKEPNAIGMRDIARTCNVSATTIYLYYKDKDDLFRKIGLDCLNRLESFLQQRIEVISSPKEKAVEALKAFRDWCFKNPRMAQLIMGKISTDSNADPATLEPFYVCNRFGQKLLEDCINENLIHSNNPKLDTNILIFGLWGCIESIILYRSDMEYWNKGTEYTDHYIQMAIKSLGIQETT